MTRTLTVLVALLLWSAQPLYAMPACPSSWNWSFSDPAESWPDVAKTSDAKTLLDMSRALYENCPREKSNDALLESAAKKFLDVTVDYSTHAANQQQSYFWLGMVYTAGAPTYDRDSKVANSAYLNFILLSDEGLREQAAEQVRALRLRSARKLAFTAHNVQVIARNYKPGWKGASQRVRCFLTTYPDTTGDKIVRKYLKDLNDWANDFINDFKSDSRYDLKGMKILAAELDMALAAPASPDNHWPTNADIDPADPRNPRSCYLRPSPIPGPENFDFDFSKKAVEFKTIEQKTNERRALLKKAEENAAAVLNDELP